MITIALALKGLLRTFTPFPKIRLVLPIPFAKRLFFSLILCLKSFFSLSSTFVCVLLKPFPFTRLKVRLDNPYPDLIIFVPPLAAAWLPFLRELYIWLLLYAFCFCLFHSARSSFLLICS